MTDDVEALSRMLRKALGDRIAPDAESFLDMIAEDGVMEFPFAPPGLPTRVEGRAAIALHLEGFRDAIILDRVGDSIVRATSDPETIVVEFGAFGRGTATGETFDQLYVSVIRTGSGHIVHYRDYWNPLIVLGATRGSTFVDALAGGALARG